MGRLVLVHGSVTNGAMTWGAQRPLAERWELIVLDRPGFAPGPAVERVDFETDALWLAGLLRPGDHLCGHSYGGVVSLLAAPSVRLESLTVLEPPAFGVTPENEDVARLVRELAPLWPTDLAPEPFLRRFVETVGALGPYDAPSPLPPEMERSVQAMMAERPPWEAQIPLGKLAATPFPKLVVSGGHNPAFDAVCDELERSLGAERAVLPGAGHSIPRAPGFTERLGDFLERAAPPQDSV